jgi:hypothetical protein
MVLPSSSVPFILSTASWADSLVVKDTKPNPFERPLVLSIITLADSISPYWEKALCNAASSVPQLRPPTKSFEPELSAEESFDAIMTNSEARRKMH